MAAEKQKIEVSQGIAAAEAARHVPKRVEKEDSNKEEGYERQGSVDKNSSIVTKVALIRGD